MRIDIAETDSILSQGRATLIEKSGRFGLQGVFVEPRLSSANKGANPGGIDISNGMI